MTNYSVLRYPGGKSQLIPQFENLIKNSDYQMFVEGFAGGASVGLDLLLKGYIDQLILNDYDAGIIALWHCIFHHPKKLTDFINSVPLSVVEFDNQRQIYNELESVYARRINRSFLFSDLNAEHGKIDVEPELLNLEVKLARATLYINRTSFSGSLLSGPIGGKSQKSKYKIDSRFNRKNLIKKINKLTDFYSENKNCVYLMHYNLADGDIYDLANVSRMLFSRTNTLFFFDPPYLDAGKQLYPYSFNSLDLDNFNEDLMNYLQDDFVMTVGQKDSDQFSGPYYYKDIILNYSANKHHKKSEVLITNKWECAKNFK